MSLSTIAGIHSSLLRAYDLRGVVGRELGPDDARGLGLAFATVARRQQRRRIGVGRDGRVSSLELERALIQGLVAGGADVVQIGHGPTPQLYYAAHALALDGGIMVTGSHNPPDQNGFKLLLGGHPVYGGALRDLTHTAPSRFSNGRCTFRNVIDGYVEALAGESQDIEPLKVVWDCGNGAVGAVIEALTALLPGTHVLLNAEVDGHFPAHHPDPAVAENLRQLQAAVVAEHADLGIAFDGDGDRIGVVDETGAIVWPDQLLLLLAEDRLRSTPGLTVVADVKSSRVLFERVAQRGGRALMAPSGYVLVRAAMIAAGAPLAGEMSGHIVFADAWHGSDDALYAALRVLDALTRRGETLAEFRCALPTAVSTPEIRLKCADSRKHDVVREVAERLRISGAFVDATDGIRVTRPEGWWLLRASGTEAKLTARCEASDESGLARLRDELEQQLALSGVVAGLAPATEQRGERRIPESNIQRENS
jgi:phosphomannomutase